MSFTGDAIDHVEYSQNIRVEGITAALVGFMHSLANGLGQGLFNLGLLATRYVTPEAIGSFEKKGKNWILINILENSFLEYMKLIIKYIELNNEENIKNDLSTNKKDILFILEELNNLKFNNNIINEDHQNYLKHIKNNGQMNKTSYKSFSIEPIINNETSGFNNEEEEDLLDFIKLDIEKYIPKDGKGFKKENKPEEFEFKKFADLIPCITENFYNFEF